MATIPLIPYLRRALILLAFIGLLLIPHGLLTATADAATTLSPEDAAILAEQNTYLDPQAPVGTEPVAPDHQMHTLSGTTIQIATDNPLVTTAANPDSAAVLAQSVPATGGQWTKLPSLPAGNNSYHMTMGPGGKILLIAGSGNSSAVFRAGTFKAYVWNPTTGITKSLQVPTDMFCSGHMLLSNGKGFAAGGTAGYGPWKGARAMYTFDFAAETFTRQVDMTKGRWYPTVISQPNGEALITGGLDQNGTNTGITEIFNPANNTTRRITGLKYFPLYPMIFTMSDGRYFFTGESGSSKPTNASQTAGIWNALNGNTFTAVSGLTLPAQRTYGTTCRIGDVRNQDIIALGGGNPATSTTGIINLNAATPTYHAGPNMPAAKIYTSCVQLPDGTLLELHGGSANKIANASREVSLLASPTATAWTVMNPMPTGEHRLYHNLAFMLDDGSIISMGSNPKGEARSNTVLRYEPPYLFKGARPTLTTVPATMTYGQTYDIGASADVTKVTVTTAPSPTHGLDANQKQLILPVVNGKITLNATSGQFGVAQVRIFALNDAGVPSIAKWSKIQ